MMYRTMARFGMVAALLAISLSSTTRLAAQTTGGADQAVKDVAKGLADGKPVVLWQALPASYQKDIKDVISDAAAKIDPEVYDKGFTVIRKAVKLLKNKKDFILNGEFAKNPAVKVDKKQLADGYDAVVAMLDTIATSEVSKLDDLKKADVEKFLTGTAPKLGSQVTTLIKLAEAANPNDANMKKFHDELANLKSLKITVVKAGDKETTLKIESPGDTKPAEEEVFVKVEGKWLPKKMVDGWKDGIKNAKDEIAQAGPFLSKDGKKQAIAFMGQIEQAVDQLDNTKTEKEFSDAIKQIVGGLMGR